MEINLGNIGSFSEGQMIRFKVNGKEKTFDGDPDMPLLWYLRDVAQLTGTKFGCGMSLMRSLYGPPERRGDPFLHHSHERSGRCRHHDH